MKKLFILLAVAAMALTACNKQAFNSTNLNGCYEVDFSALMADMSDGEDAEDQLAAVLASMFLSSMEMTMQFEDSALILSASGAAMNLINAFAKDETTMPVVLDYKIINDSILYIKDDDGDFEEFGVLRKEDDSFDHLQLITAEDDGSHMTLKLTRKRE